MLKDLVSKLGVNLEIKCVVIGRKFLRGLSIDRTVSSLGAFFLSRQGLRKRKRPLVIKKQGHVFIGKFRIRRRVEHNKKKSGKVQDEEKQMTVTNRLIRLYGRGKSERSPCMDNILLTKSRCYFSKVSVTKH